MIKEVDYVELGVVCTGACQSLDRGTRARGQEQLSRLVIEAVERLKV